MGGALHLNKLESPSPKDALVEIDPVVLEKKIFIFRQCIFTFRNNLPLENSGPFLWTKLNPVHPRMLCAKFGEIGSMFLEKKILFNFVNVFSLFRNYLPVEKGGALHLNKL